MPRTEAEYGRLTTLSTMFSRQEHSARKINRFWTFMFNGTAEIAISAAFNLGVRLLTSFVLVLDPG
jgi:hypothetical protein